MTENENICFLCEYMRVIDKPGNKWAPTFCEHPDSMYIKNYRKTHNLKSAERFVGWTKRYSKELTIKTRPRWCPKKDVRENDSGEYELKPCQCGSDVELCRGDDDYYIYCPKCKLKTFSDRVYDNITDNCDRLIDAWNRRADDDRE